MFVEQDSILPPLILFSLKVVKHVNYTVYWNHKIVKYKKKKKRVRDKRILDRRELSEVGLHGLSRKIKEDWPYLEVNKGFL